MNEKKNSWLLYEQASIIAVTPRTSSFGILEKSGA